MIAKKRKNPVPADALPDLKLVANRAAGAGPLRSHLSRAENFLWWLGDRIPWPNRTRYFFPVSLALCLAFLSDRTFIPYAVNGAFGLTAVFLLLCRYGLDDRTAGARALALAVGTPWLVFSKVNCSESLVASALLACLLVAESSALLAGLLGGVALTIRPEMVLWLPLFAYAFHIRGENLGKFGFGLFPGLVFFLWSNYFNSGGNFLPVGYREWSDFATPFYVGIYGQLFSTGNSLFLYAPVLILFPSLALHHFKARHLPGAESNPFGALVRWSSVLVLAHLLFFASCTNWSGDGVWGPRHLLPAILFCAATVAASRTLNVRAFYALCALGLLLQLPALWLGPQKTVALQTAERVHFIPRYSPLVTGFERIIAPRPTAVSR